MAADERPIGRGTGGAGAEADGEMRSSGSSCLTHPSIPRLRRRSPGSLCACWGGLAVGG